LRLLDFNHRRRALGGFSSDFGWRGCSAADGASGGDATSGDKLSLLIIKPRSKLSLVAASTFGTGCSTDSRFWPRSAST
jgi:hypothetical protein